MPKYMSSWSARYHLDETICVYQCSSVATFFFNGSGRRFPRHLSLVGPRKMCPPGGYGALR